MLFLLYKTRYIKNAAKTYIIIINNANAVIINNAMAIIHHRAKDEVVVINRNISKKKIDRNDTHDDRCVQFLS